MFIYIMSDCDHHFTVMPYLERSAKAVFSFDEIQRILYLFPYLRSRYGNILILDSSYLTILITN